jgi:hypothetical protein
MEIRGVEVWRRRGVACFAFSPLPFEGVGKGEVYKTKTRINLILV